MSFKVFNSKNSILTDLLSARKVITNLIVSNSANVETINVETINVEGNSELCGNVHICDDLVVDENILAKVITADKVIVGILESTGTRPPTGQSPNPETILVNSPLECDGGLIMPFSVGSNLTTEVINDDLSGRAFTINSVTTQVVLDTNLSSGSFGEIILTHSVIPLSFTFNAGFVNGTVSTNRNLRGYYNNAGVITGFNTQTQNLNIVKGADGQKTASTIIRWKKFNNSTVVIEATSSYVAFSLVNKL